MAKFELANNDNAWWSEGIGVAQSHANERAFLSDLFKKNQYKAGQNIFDIVARGSVNADVVGVLSAMLCKRGFSQMLLENNAFSRATETAWRSQSSLTFIDYLPFRRDNVSVYFNIMTTDRREAVWWRRYLRKKVRPSTKQSNGRCFILASTPGGVDVTELGYAAVPIDYAGYSQEIHSKIREMIADLKTPFPTGRISLLEGPPGTGKTFILRGLMRDIPNATFIFVPPQMIPQLGSPSLVPVLLRLKSEESKGPVIFLCEDADSILTKRNQSNMEDVAAMLNLSAGLIGELVDIRIVATTNADRSQIDEAILRPGRLSQYIKVAPLSLVEANALYAKLTGTDPSTDLWHGVRTSAYRRVGFGADEGGEGVKLADVYQMARRNGWRPILTDEQKADQAAAPRTAFDFDFLPKRDGSSYEVIRSNSEAAIALTPRSDND